MCIKFIPKGRSASASIHAPNTNPKSKTPTPASFVTSAAKTLKLGDGVKINYSSLSGKTWMRSLTRIPAPSKSSIPGQDASDKFTFIGARKVRTSKGVRVTIVARKGSKVWSFATQTQASASYSGSGSQSDPGAVVSSSSSLSDKISQFSSGDIVAIKYDTVGFKFVINDISPYMMTAEGKLVKAGQRIIKRVKHDTAYIRTGKLSMTLIVPRTSRVGGTDAAELASTLKSLGAQQALFTYYKKKGAMWIDKITPQ
ncbi:MAG: hypothetical protein QGH94_17990 [Phycisphaerae bacterium]|nr:hypothetical protein [Phycisphaerae bacterium]